MIFVCVLSTAGGDGGSTEGCLVPARITADASGSQGTVQTIARRTYSGFVCDDADQLFVFLLFF